MPVRISVLFLLASTCHGADVDAGVCAEGECHDLSLLQVGLALSKSPDGTPIANALTAGYAGGMAAAAAVSAGGAAKPPVKVRPGFSANKTDKVEFGVLLKNWYGIKEKEGELQADVVLTLHWSDPRATELIPAGAPSVTISGETAKDKMWLPNVVATNIAHSGSTTISSSIKIHDGGKVTMVDRLLLTVKQSMVTHNFPFDSQDVHIKVASATYMSDEVQLVPMSDKNEWGVNQGEESDTTIFSNSVWYFVQDALTVFTEVDGELSKSRGVLTITVKRSLSEFISSVFMPSVVLLTMTWSAFWLPVGGPYVMPRVALNAFALLCQLSVSQMTDAKIPLTGSRTWMTEYLSLCVQLQFTLMMLNTLILAIEHRAGGHDLAVKVNDQMILAYPLSTSLNIGILVAGFVSTSRACLAVTLFCYIAFLILSYRWHQEKQEADAEAAKKSESSASAAK